MIKKFVSNALLSMVMDKKAREKFNAAQGRKKQKATPAKQADADRRSPKKAAKPGAAPAPRPAEPRSRPPVDDTDDAEALIREALETAELELIEKRKKKPMTSERRALIEQAMAIHREKSHMLDDLDQEDRDKLTFMAMKALDRNFGE